MVKKVARTLLVSIATAVPALFFLRKLQNDHVLVPNYDLLVLEGVGLELQLLGEGLQLLLQSLTLLHLLIYLTPATP
jgi:hypothetical protein